MNLELVVVLAQVLDVVLDLGGEGGGMVVLAQVLDVVLDLGGGGGDWRGKGPGQQV